MHGRNIFHGIGLEFTCLKEIYLYTFQPNWSLSNISSKRIIWSSIYSWEKYISWYWSQVNLPQVDFSYIFQPMSSHAYIVRKIDPMVMSSPVSGRFLLHIPTKLFIDQHQSQKDHFR
jgi:hypothetical protein